MNRLEFYDDFYKTLVNNDYYWNELKLHEELLEFSTALIQNKTKVKENAPNRFIELGQAILRLNVYLMSLSKEDYQDVVKGHDDKLTQLKSWQGKYNNL